MENINKLIASEKLEIALEIVNEEISNPKNFGTDKYHELLFAKARIYIIKYKNTKPVDNKLYIQSKEDFANGDNAYKALHGKQHPKYQDMVIGADRIYLDLNRK